jgi:hypothetical protein
VLQLLLAQKAYDLWHNFFCSGVSATYRHRIRSWWWS